MAQKEEDEWSIDSRFSTHMTGDRKKIINQKEGKSDSVAFVNNSSVKILGKCIVDLGSNKENATNILLVENLKHNLLSVRKMCDQGYNNITFNS